MRRSRISSSKPFADASFRFAVNHQRMSLTILIASIYK